MRFPGTSTGWGAISGDRPYYDQTPRTSLAPVEARELKSCDIRTLVHHRCAGMPPRGEIDYEEGFFSARCVVERDVVQRTLVAGAVGPGRDLAGLRRRVEACVSAIDCPGGSHARGQIRVAASEGGALDQRSVHAHRGCKFLPTERDGAENAGRFERRDR